MSSARRLKTIYLSHFSTPASDRLVYRTICRLRAGKILELGIGAGRRAMRMIDVARHCNPIGQVQFTAIDPFEARSTADGIAGRVARRPTAP